MNLGYRTRGERSGNLPSGELKRIRNVLLVIIIATFAVIGFQLFNLQIIKGERYRSLSEDNYLRITPIPVSYTHLDVYKRQSIYRSSSVPSGNTRIHF